MTGRGRKRGRPPKTPNDRGTPRKFDYQQLKKPKYLSNLSLSHASTPSASRASSPQESVSSRRRTISTSTRGRGGRGRKSVGLSSTPSYTSRKGYESEYHYGSDFGDSSDKSDLDDDLLLSAQSEEESLPEETHDSESEFSVCSFTQTGVGRPPRPPSPDPIWLQGREYSDLNLPESSHDLLIENVHMMKALGVYEVLRRFRHLVRLSPFRFEDFCGALVCDEQSTLLSDIHIMLMKAILREEDVQGTHFGPLDQKDSVNISLYLIDAITWPEVLRSYVESDKNFDRDVYNILCSGEYPYTDVKDRIRILQFLTDQFLTTNVVRDVMLQEGSIHYDDHCRVCHRLGDLLCCETCPATYHLECVDPPMHDVPTEDWQCGLCKSHKVEGVVDCVLSQEKQGVLVRHDYMGMDRHGRKYWFISRRIFIEDQNDNTQVWYYSTIAKFEALLQLLDSTDLEAGLYAQLEERRDEIIRQFQITEKITNELKLYKKSYLDLETELEQKSTTDTETATETIKKETDAKHQQESKILTRNKLNQIKDGTLYFKLGMDMGYKSYVNQYSTNVLALNKPQRNEERDKRRHLSHKFSLTTASEFKWIGITMGTAEQLTATLRQTILSFEQQIAAPFLNHNWSSLKRLWNSAVAYAHKPADFAVVLLLLQASLKNVLFANVWHEHLGHIELKRITSTDREDRKKLEKREKRERDDEEERNRLSFHYVKYTLGLRHQVWKQKGEEYRMHGQWGWMWLSSSRRVFSRHRNQLPIWGQILLPARIQVHYSRGEKINEIICVDSRTHRLMQQIERNVKEGHDFRHVNVYRDIKLLSTPTPEDIANYLREQGEVTGIIDVSKALTTPGRLLYPKVARRSRLETLLTRRLEFKEAEEQLALNEVNDTVDSEESTAATNNRRVPYKRQTLLEMRILFLSDQNQKNLGVTNSALGGINYDLVNSLAKKIQYVRLQFSQLNRFAKQFRCYTKECNTNSNAVAQITQNTCYSPLCLQKARAKKDLLLLLRRAHTAGNGSKETVAAILGAVKKPSILELKLTEGRRSDVNFNCNSFNMDDAELVRQHEEAPLDLTIDLEQSHHTAVPYVDSLWQDCFQILTQDDELEQSITSVPATNTNNSQDVSTTATSSNLNTDVESFIDNIDVCSTVEIESSNIANNNRTVEEDITAQLTAAASQAVEDNDFTSTKRRRRTKSTRLKSTTFRESLGRGNAANTIFYTNADGYSLTDNGDLDVPKKPRRDNRRFPHAMRNIKRDDITRIEKEYLPDGRERIYSCTSPRGRIYLHIDINKWRKEAAANAAKNKLEEGSNEKSADNKVKQETSVSTLAAATASTAGLTTDKTETRSKYPLISNFLTPKLKKSLLVLPRHELMKLARLGGKSQISGYHHMAKTNNSVWPYPCSRPLFKTCWAYRTTNAISLAAVAIQLRILWSCLRWDDMIIKPSTTDGKHQITTETEIVTLELLKLRHLGRYGERTQYLRRRITIPLEMPKTIREVTSIRSGLRKRKRVESPQPSEPQVSEEWVEEDKLELWEIKYMGERQEKARLTTTTRAAALRQAQANNADVSNGGSIGLDKNALNNGGTHSPMVKNNALNSNGKTSEELKEKLEQQLKIQRATHQQKRNVTATVAVAAVGNRGGVTTLIKDGPTLRAVSSPTQGCRRMIVKAPDGTTRIIQQALPSAASKVNNSTSTSSTMSTNTQMGSTANTTNAAGQVQQHKVQIIRGSDGKVSVRGLHPGQQLIQMPDGKLHVLTTSASGRLNAPLKTAAGTVIGTADMSKNGTTAKLVVSVKVSNKIGASDINSATIIGASNAVQNSNNSIFLNETTGILQQSQQQQQQHHQQLLTKLNATTITTTATTTIATTSASCTATTTIATTNPIINATSNTNATNNLFNNANSSISNYMRSNHASNVFNSNITNSIFNNINNSNPNSNNNSTNNNIKNNINNNNNINNSSSSSNERIFGTFLNHNVIVNSNYNNHTNVNISSSSSTSSTITISASGLSILHPSSNSSSSASTNATRKPNILQTNKTIINKNVATGSQQQQQTSNSILAAATPTIQTIGGNNGNINAQTNVSSTGATTVNTPATGQKVIQQIVNTSNVQQHILVGGQRIILSPGQTIVTQRSVVQNVHNSTTTGGGQQVQMQVLPTATNASTTIPTMETNQSKTIKQVVVQAQQQQRQQDASSTPNTAASSTTNNSNMPTHHQLIVQNSALAQQLAQGKLQVANINGQQVILKPLGNNQAQIVAHVKTQSDGTAHIVTNSTLMETSAQLAAAAAAAISTNKVQTLNTNTLPEGTPPAAGAQFIKRILPTQQSAQQQQQQQLNATAMLSAQQQQETGLSVEESMRLLQGQPPGTIIKCVTAQVIQTEQGPRIVLQGLVGNDFNQQQLALVQQQVKQQLLKAQESSGKQGVLGPTKIYLAVQPVAPIMNSQPPPLTPVQQSSQQQNSSLDSVIASEVKDNNSDNTTINTDASTSLINGSSSSSIVNLDHTVAAAAAANDDSVAHGDIIREIEELQQHYDQQKQQQQQQQQQEQQQQQQMPNNSQLLVTDLPLDMNKQQLPIQDKTQYQAQLAGGNFNALSAASQQEVTSSSATPTLKRASGISMLLADDATQRQPILMSDDSPKKRVSNITKRRESMNSYQRSRYLPDAFENFTPSLTASVHLEQFKEDLKKNILRKRSVLERNIRMEIYDEMHNTKPPTGSGITGNTVVTTPEAEGNTDSALLPDSSSVSSSIDERENNFAAGSAPKMNKKARALALFSGGDNKPNVAVRKPKRQCKSLPFGRNITNKPPNTNRTTSTSIGGRMRKTPKKEKLYCICRTPYDDTKFYVGCDICSNWFHGGCVNISEEDSKKLTEFICADCKLARDTQQLYCLCRQPYDESQFYICCDKCQDWFHGRCVGIVQTEADFIDEYVCPDCQKNNTTNRANMKNLSEHEKEELRKLVKVIKCHKSAWPFKEPVDPKEAPDYYKIIKEPMDLQKIQTKIDTHQYTKLSEFIGDMTKMFDNCRYFNDKTSAFFKCAEALEAFFVQKIKEFRRNVVNHT